MNFRKSSTNDIEKIVSIINDAKDYFKENKIDQWQGVYPNQTDIKKDIANCTSYILEDKDEVVGTVSLSFEVENAYYEICGEWLSNDKYLTIHRMAIKNSYKGSNVSSLLIKNIERITIENNIYSIKVDTHEDNLVMKKFLEKNGFLYCGVVQYKEENQNLVKHIKRIAFEKVLVKG